MAEILHSHTCVNLGKRFMVLMPVAMPTVLVKGINVRFHLPFALMELTHLPQLCLLFNVPYNVNTFKSSLASKNLFSTTFFVGIIPGV